MLLIPSHCGTKHYACKLVKESVSYRSSVESFAPDSLTSYDLFAHGSINIVLLC